jgi:hypothetical protein
MKPRDIRRPIVEPAVMRIADSRGDAYVVTILDVSKSGLRISSSTALPAGTRVELRCRGTAILGETRYARNVGGGEFHLGIQVTDAPGAARSEQGELDLWRLFELL